MSEGSGAARDRWDRFLETPAMQVAAEMLGREPDRIGRHIGPYVITSWLGSGGMGDVYRARDRNLDRDVALKILPAVFALESDRLARFTREAHVLASLSHPNIAAIYGFEESDGERALVLELVEGPTLADRLSQGPIPVDEAVSIARQIAEGVEAAHEQGIVHRDLKPANIKLASDGTVKVLDFGLAKVQQPEAAGSGDPSDSPSITSASMIDRGLRLGTAAYMSPEQAKGRDADTRSDIWAFGAVVYETLSGRRAFKGEDTAETLAAVLRQEMDWTALPSSTPQSVRLLLARCLDRDPKQRLRDIGEARIVLAHPSGPTLEPVSFWRHAAPRMLSILMVGAVAGLAGWYLGLKPVTPHTVTHLTFALPEGQSVTLPASRHVIALSPDGLQMLYAANARLYLRSMSDAEPHAIPGTELHESVTTPVFSPDGQSIAFWAAADRTIKRMAVTGGAAVTVCEAEDPHGMSWGSEGIVFGQGRNGILRVSPQGGTPEVLVQARDGEEAHGPQLLPDGQHLLFTVATGITFDRWFKASVVVQSLASGERKTLIEGGTDARYVPTGHIVYGLRATLFAVPFDMRRLEIIGAPVPVVEPVRSSSNRETGAFQFSVSQTGSLIYLPGPLVGPEWGPQEVVVSDRKGVVERLQLPVAQYRSVRASPDGTRIAFEIDNGREAIIYVYALSGTSGMQRLTFSGNNHDPIWTSSGDRIAFQSERDGDRGIFWQTVDGTGTAERLTTPAQGNAHTPESWSPTGETLLFSNTKGGDISLWTLSLRDRTVAPFGDVHSRFPTGATFSPDGRWVAYASTQQDMTGTSIFVEPFPGTGAKYQLFVAGSNNTPHKPTWAPDGKALFYVPRLGRFEAVAVTTKPAFTFGSPATVPRPFQPGAPSVRRIYDVMPDGRFVGLSPKGRTEVIYIAPQIEVILNWFEELKARVRPS